MLISRWKRIEGKEIKLSFIKVKDFILLHEKFLQFDWLRAVVFQLNLKYLHVKNYIPFAGNNSMICT